MWKWLARKFAQEVTMALKDDLVAEVAKVHDLVELVQALVNNLRAEVNTAGLTVEDAGALLVSLQAVEKALTAVTAPPA